jgi:hypothetical protein
MKLGQVFLPSLCLFQHPQTHINTLYLSLSVLSFSISIYFPSISLPAVFISLFLSLSIPTIFLSLFFSISLCLSTIFPQAFLSSHITLSLAHSLSLSLIFNCHLSVHLPSRAFPHTFQVKPLQCRQLKPKL